MKAKAEAEYTVEINGMPNYEKIPKATLEPVAKKFLENILKQLNKKSEG